MGARKKLVPDMTTLCMPIDSDGQIDPSFVAHTPQWLADHCKLGRSEKVAIYKFVRVVARPNRTRRRGKRDDEEA